MDPSELSKRLTATFGAAAVICYACGYLSLRARSFALGTEPAYQLVDQVYVFNGAKFALSVLFALILTSPIIILVSWIGRRLAERVSIRVLGALEWLAAGTMLGLALISFSLVVWPAGVLLEAGLRLGTPEDPNIVQLALERAVLGEARSLALLLFCAVIVLTATASIWQVRRSTSFTRHLDFVLAAMVALLAFLLPMYHGAFLADRKVRVLSEVPEGTAVLQAPVAVVDRTAEQIALFGLDSTGDEIVVTIDSMALNGVPVSTVESLGEFIWRIKHSRNASAISHAESFEDEIIFAQLSERESDAIGLRDLAGQNVGFFTIVTDFFGMLLQNANALGGHDEAGELWTVDLDPLGKPSNRRRVGSLEDIMWPVVGRDGQPLVILHGSEVIELDEYGAPARVVHAGGKWLKLIGVAADGSILGLVRQDRSTRPVILTPDGALNVGPPASNTNEEKAIARLLQEARIYDDGDTLFIDRSERGG